MSVGMILLPLFVQVGLVFVLWLWMVVLRGRAIAGGAVRAEDIALGQKTWPARTLQVANCFSNQFELPVLFYVLVVLLLVTRQANLFFVVLAWAFVLLRIVHAAIHTGRNDVRIRGPVWGLGGLVLFVMWGMFAADILLAPALP